MRRKHTTTINLLALYFSNESTPSYYAYIKLKGESILSAYIANYNDSLTNGQWIIHSFKKECKREAKNPSRQVLYLTACVNFGVVWILWASATGVYIQNR